MESARFGQSDRISTETSVSEAHVSTGGERSLSSSGSSIDGHMCEGGRKVGRGMQSDVETRARRAVSRPKEKRKGKRSPGKSKCMIVRKSVLWLTISQFLGLSGRRKKKKILLPEKEWPRSIVSPPGSLNQ